MFRLAHLGIAVFAVWTLTPIVGADGADERGAGPIVVELFTSQSCYSCPPAERFLGELARRPGVIALEFHVDYWNDLVYGGAGRWKDVHSRPEFTRRQRQYNLRIRNQAGVYTPQMIIGGRYETVGTRESSVLESIRRVRREPAAAVDVSVRHGEDNGLSIMLNGEANASTAVWLVRFKKAEVTRVLRGENHGKTLTNYNIVTRLERLGEWSGGPTNIDVPNARPGSGEGCAVLLQGETPGAILGAAACPMAEA